MNPYQFKTYISYHLRAQRGPQGMPFMTHGKSLGASNDKGQLINLSVRLSPFEMHMSPLSVLRTQ